MKKAYLVCSCFMLLNLLASLDLRAISSDDCEAGLGEIQISAEAAAIEQPSRFRAAQKHARYHLDRIFDTAIRLGASDIHFNVGLQPLLRLHGKLTRLNTTIVTPEMVDYVMKSLASEDQQTALYEQRSVGLSFSYESPKGAKARFRVAIASEKDKYTIVLRLLPDRFLSFDQIGLPESVRKLVNYPQGLVLVVGPTGSGKTTTLASILNTMTHTRDDMHLITLEDPIEYIFDEDKAPVTQRQVGVNVPTFHDGIRWGLRMDPDVFLVGEMRDSPSILAGLEAAETAHLVFSTLHANSAFEAVRRVINGVQDADKNKIRDQLAGNLVCVISQRLLRRADGQGRVAAFEVMWNDPSIANHIRQEEFEQMMSAMQMGKGRGNQLLNDSLFELVQARVVDAREALKWSYRRDELQGRLEEADLVGSGE